MEEDDADILGFRSPTAESGSTHPINARTKTRIECCIVDLQLRRRDLAQSSVSTRVAHANPSLAVSNG